MTEFTFVKETPDFWEYEGLAIPYGGVTKAGQDLTGSHFTKSSDLCLDWFPADGRPLLYRHGFDPEVKAAPVGRESGFVKEDDRGRWYRVQVQKAKEYAAEVKQLIDEGLVSLSSGAVDHLTQISAKSGEIIRWPWVELSVVPNPANPEALIYPVKSVDAVEHLTIVETAIPEAVKGWLPEGTTQGDLDDGDFAWIASDSSLPDSERRKLPYKIHGKVNEAGWRAAWSRANQDGTDFSGGPSKAQVLRKLLANKPAGIEVASEAKDAEGDAYTAASILGSLICLLSDESDEPDQKAMIAAAFDAVYRFLSAEVAEIGTPAEEAEEEMPAYLSLKEGRRNSMTDQAMLQDAHDNIASVLSLDCYSPAGKEAPPAPRLVITGTAAAKEPDLAELTQTMTALATAKAKELLRIS
jgi:hypothetical protein